MTIRIAAVDDDPAQLDLIACTMKALGHGCHTFDHARPLLRAMRRETFDLLIVDWQMPDINGPDVVMWVREHDHTNMPILFVTARDDERDIIKGLACGADDYMLKPIRVGELVARTRALIRRAYGRNENMVRTYGDYRFDIGSRLVHVGDRVIVLKAREFDVALCLFSNLGRLLSRRHMIEAVWGFGAELTSRALDTLVSGIRVKLNLRPDNGYRLVAAYSVGYRLEAVGEAGPSLHPQAGAAQVDDFPLIAPAQEEQP